MKWNLNSNETTTLVKLPEDVFPTDMHWFPKSAAGGGAGKKGSDLFVLTSTDGNSNKISVGFLNLFQDLTETLINILIVHGSIEMYSNCFCCPLYRKRSKL